MRPYLLSSLDQQPTFLLPSSEAYQQNTQKMTQTTATRLVFRSYTVTDLPPLFRDHEIWTPRDFISLKKTTQTRLQLSLKLTSSKSSGMSPAYTTPSRQNTNKLHRTTTLLCLPLSRSQSLVPLQRDRRGGRDLFCEQWSYSTHCCCGSQGRKDCSHSPSLWPRSPPPLLWSTCCLSSRKKLTQQALNERDTTKRGYKTRLQSLCRRTSGSTNRPRSQCHSPPKRETEHEKQPFSF